MSMIDECKAFGERLGFASDNARKTLTDEQIAAFRAQFACEAELDAEEAVAVALEALNEEGYAATLAGLGYELLPSARGLTLQAEGLTGHLAQFWNDVMNSVWIGGSGDGGLHERTPYWLYALSDR